MARDLLYHPMFGITISIVAYAGALLVSAKFSKIHPLFLSSLSIMALLYICGIPYDAYKVGGDVLALLLGPSTVALGVPMYKHRRLIRKYLSAVLCGLTAGALASIVSTAILMWLFGGTRIMLLTMLPKSVSSPIALEISRSIGGIPELSAVFTVLTGLVGSMFGKALLQRLGIRDDVSVGIAMGTSAHGIGTARALRESEEAGSFSGFAMGMAGIVTALLFIPVGWWIGR